MTRNEKGFTLVELMVTMIIFVLVIAASSQIFTALLTQFKQQSKIAETNTEGIIGLDIMRRDLAAAGYGLPWKVTGVNYSEAVNDGVTGFDDTIFNDADPGAAVYNPPRALVSGSGLGLNGSDVLVVKSLNVAMNDTCQKSSYISKLTPGALPNNFKVWDPTDFAAHSVSVDDLDKSAASSDNMIVVMPTQGNNRKVLCVGATGAFSTARNDNTCSFNGNSTTCDFEPPVGSNDSYVVYGLTPHNITPRMPFNRADYYIKIPANMPARCAKNVVDPTKGTGVLYKGTIQHSDGTHSELPLLDCVADIKVDYWLANSDGTMRWPPVHDLQAGIAALPADADCGTDVACRIRKHLMEIRVYIVAQEGQVDPNYDFTNGDATKVSVSTMEISGNNSEPINSTTATPFAFANLKTLVGTVNGDANYYRHYRWKLYTLVIQPNTLR